MYAERAFAHWYADEGMKKTLKKLMLKLLMRMKVMSTDVTVLKVLNLTTISSHLMLVVFLSIHRYSPRELLSCLLYKKFKGKDCCFCTSAGLASDQR
jgi:hypothetical protein